jgi:hypothetical protein
LKRWLPFGLGFLFFLLAGFSFFPGFLKPMLRQPIAFNHKKHMENGLECTTCHEFVKEERFAGIPSIAICLTCHEEAVTESPEEEKIRVYTRQKQEIPWVRLFRQPGHVYYSHRRHVAIGKIECVTCHGEIGQSLTPPLRPPTQLTMDDCLSCHKKVGRSTDCTSCHK